MLPRHWTSLLVLVSAALASACAIDIVDAHGITGTGQSSGG